MEKGKGNELVKNTTKLLEESKLNFVGNVEGDSIFQSDVDVVVCDGFTGNMILKNTENVAHIIVENFVEKHKTKESEGIKDDVFKMFYYNDQAGAILLGTKKPVVKVHGKANRHTIAAAIDQIVGLYEGDFVSKIKDAIVNE